MDSDSDTPDQVRGGLPHSEIPGSTIARISPGLFAACHVLHRLSVPRHPPDALLIASRATPNGKDHLRRNATRFAEGDRRKQPLSPKAQISEVRYQKSEPIGAANFSPEDTFWRNPPAREHMPSPRCFRLGHTTRFFTIVHQHQIPASKTRRRRIRC